MNCPSRTDDPGNDGYNQSPSALAADLTVREDLNGRVNYKLMTKFAGDGTKHKGYMKFGGELHSSEDNPDNWGRGKEVGGGGRSGNGGEDWNRDASGSENRDGNGNGNGKRNGGKNRENNQNGVQTGNGTGGAPLKSHLNDIILMIKKYLKFVGPGFMVCSHSYPKS